MSLKDLFVPKWKNSDWRIRKDAVEVITDQKTLSEVALTDENAEVRKLAVRKVNDQLTLTDIAKRDKNETVRLEALSKIYDEHCLLEFTGSVYPKSRAEAVRKINNKTVLAEVAMKDPDAEIRYLAAIRSGDQKILGIIAKFDPDPWKRIAAVEKITNPLLLEDIQISDTRGDVRKRAMITLIKLRVDSCMHVFSEWESCPCCIDAPFCNCDQTVIREIRKCKICGSIDARKR